MKQKERLERLRALRNPEQVTDDILNYLASRIESYEVEPLIPESGVDYFTEAEVEEIVNRVRSLVSDGVDGKDGEQGPMGLSGEKGESGKDGRDGRDGRDGESPDINTVIKEVLSRIPKPKEVSIEDVLKRIKLPETKNYLSKDDLIDYLRRGGFRGGGISSVVHDATLAGDGTIADPLRVISSGSVTVETPTGVVNESNVTFTVTQTPKWIVIDGLTYFDGQGYSIAALTLTVDVPPAGFIRSIY